MTTTAAVEKSTGHPGENKEKNEKRRALGRGLESLLPGPRAVAAMTPAAPAPASSDSTLHGAPGATAAAPPTVPFIRGAAIDAAVPASIEEKKAVTRLAPAETPGNFVVQLAIADIEEPVPDAPRWGWRRA